MPSETRSPGGPSGAGGHGGRPQKRATHHHEHDVVEAAPGAGADPSEPESGEAVVDRLARLLPEEPLQDALKGLEPEEITGPGGLLTQLPGG